MQTAGARWLRIPGLSARRERAAPGGALCAAAAGRGTAPARSGRAGGLQRVWPPGRRVSLGRRSRAGRRATVRACPRAARLRRSAHAQYCLQGRMANAVLCPPACRHGWSLPQRFLLEAPQPRHKPKLLQAVFGLDAPACAVCCTGLTGGVRSRPRPPRMRCLLARKLRDMRGSGRGRCSAPGSPRAACSRRSGRAARARSWPRRRRSSGGVRATCRRSTATSTRSSARAGRATCTLVRFAAAPPLRAAAVRRKRAAG